MTVSLSITSTSTSTPSFLCASLSISSAKQPSFSHKSLAFPIHSSLKNLFSLPIKSLPSPRLHNRLQYDLRCCFSLRDESFDSMDEKDEETEESGSDKMWESVETLTKYYKEAVVAGDYQTCTEIETMFYRLETEKNELVERLSTLTEEVSSGKERLFRLQADFDNYRKRSEKERLSIRDNAQGEVIESLLPMVDNFERAKQQLKPETDKERLIDTSYQGIYKQFVEIMRSLRVAVIATVGKPFDPSLHEAIAREESEEFKEGIIIQEFRRGFLLGDRLLRPAMVKVSSGPGKKKDYAATLSSPEQPAAAAGVDEL